MQVAIQGRAVEWNNQDPAPVHIVAPFLGLGNVDDRKREVSDVPVFEHHARALHDCPVVHGPIRVAHKVLGRIERGQGRKEDLDLLLDMCDNMKGKTICVLSDAAAMPIESYLKYFREEFETHIRERACPLNGKSNT